MNEKKVSKVVEGGVATKKKSGVAKLKRNFISDEANGIGSYIVMDILIPAAKKAMYDIVVNGINMMLYGEAATPSTSRFSGGTTAKISYNECYAKPKAAERSNRWYDFDDILFDLPRDAEYVITKMNEIVDTYNLVSVADMYDLSGLSCDWTAQNYGWTNVAQAHVVPVHGTGKFTIKLPKALPIR